MNNWIMAAGTLSGLTCLAHVIGGGKEVHHPMLNSPLSPLLKGYASVLWHMVTVVLVTDTVALLLVASGQASTGVLQLIFLQSIGFTALFIGYGMSRHGNLTTMPQWIAFGLIAILIGAGLAPHGVQL